MITQAKPFQTATAEAVLTAFSERRRYRRFLVAHEVGLGKTVVAQHVLRGMMGKKEGPLVVLYLCSNLSIAAQNQRKFLELLPPDERDSASCRVDRLALFPAASDKEKPSHPSLHLYCLTPDTSIPLRKNRRRDGRQEERALIHALIGRTFPSFFSEWKSTVFRRNASTWWKWYVREQEAKARNKTLQDTFKQSVQREFDLEAGHHLLPKIRGIDDLELIARLRNALAVSALEQLQPDLVIFDEFQRFPDLLKTPDKAAARPVIELLLGETGENPPALLLLSATPYRPYSRRWEEEAGGASHREEFFDLVETLYGRTPAARMKRATCERYFGVLEAELRRGSPSSPEAGHARCEIEALLRPVMARTERTISDAARLADSTQVYPAPLHSDDLKVFKHTSDSFHESHRSSSVQYWTSIPFPMQAMGNHYVAWKAARAVPPNGVPKIDEFMRNRFEKPHRWPHPRLRALREMASPQLLRAPWVAPSNPWWNVEGVWKDRPRKLLVFSRFQAVPQSVAAALSFDLECEFLANERLSYPEVTRRRVLVATEKRHALLALFHPSPLLVERTEPLAEGAGSLTTIRSTLRKQIRAVLRRLEIGIHPAAQRLPLWKLLARMESRAGKWNRIINAWWQLQQENARSSDEDGGLAPLLHDWAAEAARPIERVHPSAVRMLVEYALSAPGVIVGRALRRHWKEAVGEGGYAYCLRASWNGLRSYLDQRWFFSALRRKEEKYPDTICRLSIEGNLEAVLDEHLWITSRLRSLSKSALADELREGLSVKIGLFFFQPLGKDGETFSIRCHAAMPFGQARVGYAHDAERGEKLQDRPLRTDELRKAFNTPFWPHVLITTSVGQEGLDFHVWCDTLVHWDLCRNPVDLEQREGRIQRFGGLSIRRAIIDNLGPGLWEHRSGRQSPWRAIARLADAKLADKSGLAPWWVCPGGGVSRHVFEVPSSEQRHWLRWAQEQRLLYRLALGQPNQEDLVEVLAGKGLTEDEIRRAMIDLSPWATNRQVESVD